MTAEVMLVWRCRTLGDPILSIPALQALRSYAHVTIVGYPDAWELARSDADDIVSIEDPPYDALLGYPAAGLPNLRDVDLAIALTSLPVRQLLEAAGVHRVVQRSPVPPPDVHAADWLLDVVREGGALVLPGENTPVVMPARGELDRGRELLAHLGLDAPIILHPGSSEWWKRWPAERYGRLADVLGQLGYQVAMIAGAEDQHAAEMARSHTRSRLTILPLMPPRLLASVLACASLFVGNDTGVTHLAAAVGAPIVALFGPTDPICWAPRGNVRVIRACQRKADRRGQIRVCDAPDCMGQIEVDDVLDGVRAQLDRAVCAGAGW